MNRRSLAWLFVFTLVVAAGCGHVSKNMGGGEKPPDKAIPDCVKAGDQTEKGDILAAGCYTLSRPGERAKRRDLFFAGEYDFIRKRRGNNWPPVAPEQGRPADLVGLALSGGGMRANAFHLGILSGLYETPIPGSNEKNKNLLDRVDYISSVSGGTWALAAYLFNDDRCDGTTIFRRCAGCGAINDRVPHFLVNRQGEMHRENWRKEIGHDFVAGSNYQYSELPDLAFLDSKPYFIINATHSAMSRETGSERNFNFQFTRDSLGTVVDCLSETGKTLCGQARKFRWLSLGQGLGTGFFVNNPKGGKGGFDLLVNDFLQGSEFNREIHVADILAASSAVVDKLYGSYLKVEPKGGCDRHWYEKNRIRSQYRLSDGGKSENIGVLSLVERGVQIIVASQIAEDVHHLNHWWEKEKRLGPEFGDLDMLTDQIETLFGYAIGPKKKEPDLRENESNTEAIETGIKKGEIIVQSIYRKKSDDTPAGKILFVKPTYDNIEGFKDWLKEERKQSADPDHNLYADMIRAIKKDEEEYNSKKGDYLTRHSSRFPQNPTFCDEYDMDLIRAYYLLGRYIVRKKETGLGNMILEEVGLSDPKK
ncbi:MAG: patatin-like phospholipase family protein [Desulfobacterales bacterium]|nr:patatin-like phospholipase family protein [Desulfobacterales bacterium]